ncbi:hypothetical protein GmHk_05G014163 [Glycine max]|nr:hypothetical protein GmHk_05G014163 [Glycine max]
MFCPTCSYLGLLGNNQYEVVKCNTDAAIFQEDQKFDVAACIRDSNGLFCRHSYKAWFNGIPAPLEAGFLYWIENANFNSIFLESIKAKKFQNNEQ